MSHGLRGDAVAALVALAASPDCRDRADAGRGLACFAELAQARATLLALVLDKSDTYVTRETAQALLRRHDAAGLAVVASALADASPNHADWIDAAVLDVFGVFADARDTAVRCCEALTQAEDERVRLGAVQLIDMLVAIDPVLRPGEEAD